MNSQIPQTNSLSLQDFERFTGIADSLRLPVIAFDTHLEITFANRAALQILQMNDVPSGTHIRDIVPSEQMGLVRRGLDELVEGAEPSALSLRAVRNDGVHVPVETYAQQIRSPDGLEGFLAYAIDMTHRTRVEENLRERERFFELIVEHSQSGIFIIDNEYKFEYLNDRLADIVGRTRGQILHHDFREFLHPQSVELVTERYIQRQRGERVPQTYEFKVLHSDGSPRDVRITSTTMKGQDGSIKTVAQIIDITDEKESKRALKRSERKYRTLVETMEDGLGIDNENGIVTYANEKLLRMTDKTLDDIVGHGTYELFHSWTPTIAKKKMNGRKKGETEHYEADLVHKSGKLIPVMVSASPLFDENNKYQGSFAIITDISDLKEAEAEVRFLLDLLLHDIGNQLQLILAGADLCQSDSPPELITKARNYVHDGASRCLELITKIRNAEAAKAEPLKPVDLIDVLESEMKLVSREYDVDVQTQDLPDSAIVEADTALVHLLWNLLENAAKHNKGEDSRIWVFGEQTDGRFILHVADNGPGLENAEKAALFDSERRFGGVGLHLVNRLADKYDAHLSVEDRIEGEHSKGLRVSIAFAVPNQ
jgi:PAS domain S-box-containing protein